MKRGYTYQSTPPFYEGRELILNSLKIIMFSIKETNGGGIKMFTRKQMLQILRIALAQVKAGAPLKMYLMRLENSYILCVKQNINLKANNNIINSIEV